MKMNDLAFDGLTPIDGYGPGFFRVGGKVVEGAAVVTAQAVSGWGGLGDADTPAALAGEVDVLLIGTGAEMAPLPAALRDPLEALGLGLEPMATPTACRTYNVLLSEGRRVAAALVPVSAAP